MVAVRIDQPDDGGDVPVPAALDASEPDRVPDAVRPPDAGERTERALEHRAKVDEAYRAHAIDQGCARVEKIERETVTPAMRRIEAEDPERHLAGLEHRLKGKERLAEKVRDAMTERARTVDQAFTTVKDAIRYTFC